MRLHAFTVRAAAGLVVAALASSLPAQTADTSLFRRNSASLFGLPGLVQVPSAGTTPQGTVEFTYNGAEQSFALGNIAKQSNALVTIGFLPWLTLGARGTAGKDSAGESSTRDLAASLQIRLVAEHGWAPAIAIGAQDVGGAAPNFESRYLVASKTWLGGSTVSIGYGIQSKVLHGLFGGIGVGLGPWAMALGEFDGHAVNGGVRVFAFPSLADRIGLQPRVDVVWRQGVGGTVGFGIRTMIGGRGEALPRHAPAPTRPPATAAPTPPTEHASAASTPGVELRRATRTTATIEAEQQLIALGLENVRVAIGHSASGPVIDVDYENRRYNRDELDALGVVMGVAAVHADSVRRMRVTIRRVDLPVMTVESDVGAFVAFVNDRLSAPSFAEQLTFVNPTRNEAADGAASSRGNPSRWKLDLFVRPRVETQLYTDLGVASARVTALADAYLQLGPGLVLNARRGIPVTTSSGFLGSIEDPNADRLLLHQALRVPLGDRWPLSSAITQFSAGRFGHSRVGLVNETDVSLAGGRVSVGSTLGIFGATFDTPQYSVALGTARVRFPVWDVTTSLTAGRFRHGDTGAAAELARQFGATELAFYFRSTSFASVAGVRVSLPLAPTRELAPARLRLRAPDLHTQEVQSVVLAPINELRRDIGRPLATDHEIARVYRTRDRLQPVTIVAHVETLKTASRRWLGADLLLLAQRPDSLTPP